MADKRLIDANALEEVLHERCMEMREKCSAYNHYVCGFDDAMAYVEDASTIDAVEVVRCRECKHSEEGLAGVDGVYCNVWDTVVCRNGYCDHGAKMDGGVTE